MNYNFLNQRLLFKVLFCLTVFSFLNCGEASIRKEPFALTLANYQSRSPENTAFLAHGEDRNCGVFLDKRIHNVLFFWPINGYSTEDISKIAKQKMVRYKNILRIGDLLWNIFFFTTFLTYTIEVESCETGLVAVPRHELEHLQKNMRDKGERTSKEPSGSTSESLYRTSSRDTKLSSEAFNSDIPVVRNYKTLIQKQFFENEQPFSVFFSPGGSWLTNEEKKKVEAYAKYFLSEHGSGTQKILLIGHSDYTGDQMKNFNLSSGRVVTVSNHLRKLGVPEDKVYLTFTGGLRPDNLYDVQAKKWNRRVDLILMD